MPLKKISVSYSRRFLKQASRLTAEIIDQAQKKERIFRTNPFDPRLNTHRLQGKEKEVWSFSINYSYRIKFIFLTRDEVLFLEIGAHKIYR